jgi:hypothetical protein
LETFHRWPDGVDLACLDQYHDLLALRAVVLGAGRGLLEHADNAVAGAPGGRAKIALLTLGTWSSMLIRQ